MNTNPRLWVWALMGMELVFWVGSGFLCLVGLWRWKFPPATVRRSRSLAILGFLFTAMTAVAIATTRFMPVAALLAPAPVSFAIIAFRPQILVRLSALWIYLITCVFVGLIFGSLQVASVIASVV
jgi:hypothetical protein